MVAGGKQAESISAVAGQASNINSSQYSSPYLQFNPAVVASNDSDYIYPEGSTGAAGRGRFELMFNTIGGFTAAGGAIGGINGAYAGLQATKLLTGQAKRTQMINFVAKRTASWAQMAGVVSLMYSATGTILTKARGHDDELNTLGSGAITGLLFKSTAGARGCLRGGAIGLGITSAYVLLTSGDRVRMMLGR